MPHHHMVLPHYMGRGRGRDIEHKNSEENQKGISRQDSFSSRSPLQDIPLLLPLEADGLAASNIDSKLIGPHLNHNLVDRPNGECGSYSFSFQKSEVEVEVAAPDARINGHVYDLDCMDLQSEMDSDIVAQCGMKASDECETPKEGDHDVAANDCVGPCTSCHVQVSSFLSMPH